MGNSAQHAISLKLETVYGTTPANPEFSRLGITGTTLALSKSVIESETIRSDRQLTDVRHGNRQIAGDISYELNYDGFSAILEAVMGGTWTADVLVPGTTRRSFSILRHFTELAGAAYPFHRFVGCEFNTFSLTVAPDAIVKGTFGVMGKNWIIEQTAPVGTTYAADTPSSLKPFDSFTGTVEIDGVPVATVTEITMTLENGMEPRFVVGSDTTRQPKIGKTRVTGSLTLYFEDSVMLQAFNGGVKKSLKFTLEDLDGNTLEFNLPSILGTGGQVDVQGEADITIPFPFSAIYEDGAGTPNALVITRASAA